MPSGRPRGRCRRRSLCSAGAASRCQRRPRRGGPAPASAPAPQHRPGAAPAPAPIPEGTELRCTHPGRGGACPTPGVSQHPSRGGEVLRCAGSGGLSIHSAAGLPCTHPRELPCTGWVAGTHPRGSGLPCTHPWGGCTAPGAAQHLPPCGWGVCRGVLHRTQPRCPPRGAASLLPSPVTGSWLPPRFMVVEREEKSQTR